MHDAFLLASLASDLSTEVRLSAQLSIRETATASSNRKLSILWHGIGDTLVAVAPGGARTSTMRTSVRAISAVLVAVLMSWTSRGSELRSCAEL